MRAALINIGKVLTANKTVETDPARTATLAMPTTLWTGGLRSRRVRHPSSKRRVMGEFPYTDRTKDVTPSRCRRLASKLHSACELL